MKKLFSIKSILFFSLILGLIPSIFFRIQNPNGVDINSTRLAVELPKVKLLDEKDFYWDKEILPYKDILIKYVNKIYNEMEECSTIDAGTLSKSSQKSTKDNPVFFISCGQGNSIHNVFFSKNDVETNKLPKSSREINDEMYMRAFKGKELLSKMVREPESLKINSTIVMEDMTVCFDFRAKNGFGGVNVEQAVFDGRVIYISPSEEFVKMWNKKCANQTGRKLSI